MFYYIYVKYLLHKELALHNYIRKRRKERHLSQDMLAQKANVTRQTINAIENAKYDPSLALAFKLATILETTVDQLFTKSEDEND
ncbi:Transcriptional regulator, Cro/CI family [Leuconostoc citreum KM20]|jgi:putative transcriptional regulator|uniref:Transcriptional regulator, Cro/CI family n=1 Tax=Leuconostoc citreum (strain KM20) TaxID=349519 RepID=B1MVS8_LEUCK|nr:Transcriptional regulator, Cro/CI family [Leuconostoc citreum KM20]